MAGKKMTIEEGFSQLGDIMNKMEDENISLEESFELYDKGLKLVKELKGKLDDTEKKIITLEE